MYISIQNKHNAHTCTTVTSPRICIYNPNISRYAADLKKIAWENCPPSKSSILCPRLGFCACIKVNMTFHFTDWFIEILKKLPIYSKQRGFWSSRWKKKRHKQPSWLKKLLNLLYHPCPPGKLNWNLKITQLKENHLNRTFMILGSKC